MVWLWGATTPSARDDFLGDTVEQIDRPAKRVQEPMERPRDEQRDALGARKAETLGNEFAEDHLQDREKAEDDHERDAVSNDGRPRARESARRMGRTIAASVISPR